MILNLPKVIITELSVHNNGIRNNTLQKGKIIEIHLIEYGIE